MTTHDRTFNLSSEAVVPVARGSERRMVSVLEALTDAHQIDGLALPMPTMVPAVLRQVLLPVIVDALGPPRSKDEWAERWAAGAFDAEVIRAYLTEHQDRFDLFHPVQPFAQVAGLRSPKDETKPSSLLIPNLPNGNNVPLFQPRSEGDPPALSPGDAALWLLHAQCWDTAAIKTGAVDDPKMKGGKTTGNPVASLGRLGVIVPQGRTLFHTLMLNTPILAGGLSDGDRPQWRADPLGPAWEERGPLGLLDLWTWQSRRIRLVVDDGDDPTVSRVLVAAGDRLVTDPEREWHTAWRIEKKPKKDQPTHRPRQLRAGRSAWQGFDALLALDPPAGSEAGTSRLIEQMGGLREQIGIDHPVNVLTVGIVYGNQSAVVEHVVSDTIPLPVAALRQDAELRDALMTVADQADRLARALNRLADDLRRAQGGDATPWDQGQRPEVEILAQLDPWVRRLLTGLQAHPEQHDDALDAWEQVAYRATWTVAERLLTGVPPSAFAGRATPDGKWVHRPALAEAVFRRAVTDILPRSLLRPDPAQPAEAS